LQYALYGKSPHSPIFKSGFLFLNIDETYLSRCIELAKQGRGHVSPNPRVGAVVISENGNVIGEGYHQHYGDAHAEVAALSSCENGATRGSTLYVNLEPCCYIGHTPPCTDAIIGAGIKQVIISSPDPNPKVNGKGISKLRENGISVSIGQLAEEAKYLNRGYFSRIQRKRAWCAAKIALSIDGKMANLAGQSKWITGKEARQIAHSLRADNDGILVGRNTVQLDDPELTVRMVEGSDPVRIVLAGSGKIATNSVIARTTSSVRTIMVVDLTAEIDDKLSGLELLRLPSDENGIIDPQQILRELPAFGIQSILIEGGAKVLSSFMAADMLDEISIGVAPSIIGQGISPMEHFIPASWEERPKYRLKSFHKAGSDFIMTYVRGE
jgi:diaminohydroxyphosphoribosylaminopyrimidine deaminase/5-amino-6-(5-phosphoribosylamino)uracil reductase